MPPRNIRRACLQTVAAIGIGVSSCPLAAQGEGQVLRAGTFVDGNLDGSNGTASIPLFVDPGQEMQLDAIPGVKAASELDLVLTVLDPDGEEIANDDDSGGNYNPRVTFLSERGGLHTVQVHSLAAGGAFTLLAREDVFPARQPTQLTLTNGRVEKSLTFPSDEDALFSFSPRVGGVYQIFLLDTSDSQAGQDSEAEQDQKSGEDAPESFSDPFLELFQGLDTRTNPIDQNDDGVGILDSRLVLDAVTEGPYTVRVSSLSGGGKAMLRIIEMVEGDAPVSQLELAAPNQVTLSELSPFVTEQSNRRLWQFALLRLPPGNTLASLAEGKMALQVEAASVDVDPYLELGFDTPFGFLVAMENDDDAESGGLDSRITLDPASLPVHRVALDSANWWDLLRIRVSSSPGATGDIQVTASITQKPRSAP